MLSLEEEYKFQGEDDETSWKADYHQRLWRATISRESILSRIMIVLDDLDFVVIVKSVFSMCQGEQDFLVRSVYG